MPRVVFEPTIPAFEREKTVHVQDSATTVIDKLNAFFLFTGSTAPFGPWPLIFSFRIILQTVGLLGHVISSLQGLYLNTGQHKHRINTYTYQISMSYVRFKPTIPAFQRAKVVHVPECATSVTDKLNSYSLETNEADGISIRVKAALLFGE
jgi:hypothetical protein